MESHRLFIALDQKGLNLLLKIIQHLIANEAERCFSSKHVEEWISVLTYPSYMEGFDVEELPDVFFEWIPKCDVFKEEFLVSLQKISEFAGSATIAPTSKDNVNDSSEDEFLSSSLHELADKLLVHASPLVEIYVLGAEEMFKEANVSLLASLKRIELSYPAHLGLLSEPYCNRKKAHVVWRNYINFTCISVEELLSHLKSYPLWSGTVNLKFEQCNGDMPLQYYFMYDTDPASDTSIFSSTNIEHRKMMYDTKIEIVSTVRREALPLHLINPHKYVLRTFSSSKDEGYNFFDAGDQDHLFLGILRYDDCNSNNSKKYVTTSDWISHVSDPFTHSLCPLYQNDVFYMHHAIVIEYDKANDSIFLYFFLCPEDLNIAGFLELLKSEMGYVTNDIIAASTDPSEKKSTTFYRNAADIIPPWEWCEKNSWHQEENSRKVAKSISRLKSEELFMQGVMIPGVEPLNNNINTEHDLLDTILTMFDKTGQATTGNLHPIPVIEDRLLKNIKGEESLVDMDYTDAKNVIGHGLDYCIDSLGSMHLSDRLIKVQKRFVPQDTINITTGNLTSNEESAVVAAKKNVLRSSKVVSQPLPQKQNIKKKESRTEKHKRRLKTIVEGTVAKYGQMSQKHYCYKQCCQVLFDTCVKLVKELKTSKDLNSQMKQFAKTHVKEVTDCVLAKHAKR